MIREEVLPVYQTASNPIALASRLANCPRLLALYHEVLRLSTSSVSVRDVRSNVEIGGKLLRAGSRVLLPYRQMLFDDDVFGNNTDVFNSDRFLLDQKLHKSPSFKPFGGGTTYCPGRFLARAEVLTFIALVVCRFDLELAPNKGIRTGVPRMEGRRPCLGIMGLENGGDIILKVRQVER